MVDADVFPNLSASPITLKSLLPYVDLYIISINFAAEMNVPPHFSVSLNYFCFLNKVFLFY